MDLGPFGLYLLYCSCLIIEKYGSRSAFSKALGISERSLSLKLNNKVGFRQIEIEKSKEEIIEAIVEVLSSLSPLDLKRVLVYARSLE